MPIAWGLLCTHGTGLTPECEICHQQWKWAWKQEDGIATQCSMRNEAKGLWTCSCPKHSRKMIFQSDIMEVPGEIIFHFDVTEILSQKLKYVMWGPPQRKLSSSEMAEYTLLRVGLNGPSFPYRGSLVTCSKEQFLRVELIEKCKRKMLYKVWFFADTPR